MHLDTVMNQWNEKNYATIFSFGKMFFCWNRSICIQWSLGEETWLQVCSMPLHTNETREQKTHNIWEVESFFWNKCYTEKLLRLNSIKGVMRSFIYCISARIMCLFQELFCCCCCCWYKQRLGPWKQAIRAYFGICLVSLRGVHGVFLRLEK